MLEVCKSFIGGSTTYFRQIYLPRKQYQAYRGPDLGRSGALTLVLKGPWPSAKQVTQLF